MKQDESTQWTIAEVAKASNVSSRTLRHYQQRGLLEPAWTGHNGYRYYGQPELLRLQRILLLRELGLGLETIGEVLDGQTDTLEALAVHRKWLLAERDRLDRMSRTVDATMSALRQGDTMSAENIFKDFDNNPYEAEARELWGDTVVDESKNRHAAMSPTQKQAFMDEAEAATTAMLECLNAGLPADDARTQAAVGLHHQWILYSWTPDKASYTGLGRMYVDDPRFKAFYDKYDERLAAYLRDAMAVYAERNLA
ncbi:MerR family transcriptional regulator [Arthrobacter sp. CJ23]|uniref:MerR family transcriptional regulator n=1 Tax=Arthrobacter sp. CJ23 TaxID=2972479 RepID=UPI00215BB831|nr:MerR family transcriptional regulator [Arthrobacter sp. CJ23]UVJ38360.1 MerR family transcriptional regulator [Arthrobacter sp. CJ23]